MQIVFTLEAKGDLDDLRSWLQPLSPSSLMRVTARLEQCVRTIEANPLIGKPTSRENVRVFIEPRYGFDIPYMMRDETLYILRVYRTLRRPLDYMKLQTP